MFDPWIRKIPLEEEMATHSSILAWRIPWTEEPGGLQSTGLQRGKHDLATERKQRVKTCKSLRATVVLESLTRKPVLT